MEYREAAARDLQGIARLHAESWRRHYRGAYLDSFLDGDVVANRMTVWSERLARPATNHYTVVAHVNDSVHGFAHTILDADPTWGALLDNLHVDSAMKRQGIGTRLIIETARELAWREPSTGLYLWVLEQNTDARAFYEARGASCVQHQVAGPFPRGGHAPALRYAWPNISGLGGG